MKKISIDRGTLVNLVTESVRRIIKEGRYDGSLIYTDKFNGDSGFASVSSRVFDSYVSDDLMDEYVEYNYSCGEFFPSDDFLDLANAISSDIVTAEGVDGVVYVSGGFEDYMIVGKDGNESQAMRAAGESAMRYLQENNDAYHLSDEQIKSVVGDAKKAVAYVAARYVVGVNDQEQSEQDDRDWEDTKRYLSGPGRW